MKLSAVIIIVVASCVYAAKSYVLLTGDLDSVQGIVKGLENSSVAIEIRNLLKEAAEEFRQMRVKKTSSSQKKNDGTRDENGEKYIDFRRNGPAIKKLTALEAEGLDKKSDDILLETEILDQEAKREAIRRKTRSRRMKYSVNDFVALSKSASKYLESLKQVFKET